MQLGWRTLIQGGWDKIIILSKLPFKIMRKPEMRGRANRIWMCLWFGLFPGLSPRPLLFILSFFFLLFLLNPGAKSETSFGISPTPSCCTGHFQSWIRSLLKPVNVDPFSYKAFCDETWPISAPSPYLTSLLLYSLTLAVLRGWA